VGHGGADAGYRAYTGRFPEHGFAIAVLCNASTANPQALADSVSNIFLKGVFKAPSAPAVATTRPSAAELARLAGLYVNPITGSVTLVSVRDSGLIVGRTAGPALVPIAERRFWFAPQRAEWEFKPNGELVASFKGPPSRKPVTLVRREAARPSPAELARYAGTYSSDELGATYTVSATDTALVLRTRTSEPLTFTPSYGDAFGGPFMLEFTRDQRGGVTGMLVNTGRVRNLRFVKTR
jgi:hypothetical protein